MGAPLSWLCIYIYTLPQIDIEPENSPYLEEGNFSFSIFFAGSLVGWTVNFIKDDPEITEFCRYSMTINSLNHGKIGETHQQFYRDYGAPFMG